jgi:hypothetical protein
MPPSTKTDPTLMTTPFAIAQSRTITRPLTEAQIHARNLALAECRRIAANIKRPVKGCK